uniref:Uncharacterized protein n=1 Tax=mine drainage metagenome TaxID=410659 RepID=E6QHS1_9ZZZZ
MVAVPIPDAIPTPQGYRARFPQQAASRPVAYSPSSFEASSARGPIPVPVPVPSPADSSARSAPQVVSASPSSPHQDWVHQDWINLLAAGSLLAAGALVVTGHRRAGLAVAAAGTALALVEERGTIAAAWKALPGYLGEAQSLAEQVEGFLQELATQGEKLQSILRS